MNRTIRKLLLIGAVVTIALFFVAPQADAQWSGYYRPAAWGCCYAPTYVSGCYSCASPCYYGSDWYLGVRPGPVRRAVLGPYRWYGVGCYGCGWRGGWGCGYYGGGCGCNYGCGSCGYDVGSCCGETPMTEGTLVPNGKTPTPAKKPVIEPPAQLPVEPTPTLPGPPSASPPKTTDVSPDSSGVLTVWVPVDAKVTINGLETRSKGSRRQFISYGLQPGMNYKYVIKAEVVRNGMAVEDTRSVTLTAGQTTAVAFGFNTAPTEQMASAR
jgi:uncharacterized protein (TIGR03000 family)